MRNRGNGFFLLIFFNKKRVWVLPSLELINMVCIGKIRMNEYIGKLYLRHNRSCEFEALSNAIIATTHASF